MRLVTLLVLVLGMTAVAFAAPSTTNVHQYAQKPWNEISNQDGVRIQGDTIGDPFYRRRPALHGHGQHRCNFINDYDYVCPYSGSTSADVVYAWVATAGGTGAITVDLCASVYDTKVYVYNSSMAVIACNDDYCSFQSIVSNVPVTVGATYYIVVDGYGGSCGTYNMLVDWYTPCVARVRSWRDARGRADLLRRL